MPMTLRCFWCTPVKKIGIQVCVYSMLVQTATGRMRGQRACRMSASLPVLFLPSFLSTIISSHCHPKLLLLALIDVLSNSSLLHNPPCSGRQSQVGSHVSLSHLLLFVWMEHPTTYLVIPCLLMYQCSCSKIATDGQGHAHRVSVPTLVISNFINIAINHSWHSVIKGCRSMVMNVLLRVCPKSVNDLMRLSASMCLSSTTSLWSQSIVCSISKNAVKHPLCDDE
jgi:hypothetical protein